jgi:type III pantothenate kinase
VVIDIGTAITFDVVSKNCEFLGGIIAPGPEISARALSGHCALLPYIKLRKPQKAIGKNTWDNINLGLYWGIAGLIERGVKNIEMELGEKPKVIGTGGAIDLFSDIRIFDEIIPTLTLEGIAISYYKTKDF